MLILDLETIPRQLPEKLIEYRKSKLSFRELKLGNLKDPEKIMQKKQEVDEENINLVKTMTDSDGADIDYAEIIAAGIVKDDGIPRILIRGEKTSEEEIVKRLINVIGEEPYSVVGFAIAGFDIPIIKRACLRYGLEIPTILNSRYGILDLMEQMKDTYRTEIKKQKIYCMYLGMDVDIQLGNSALVHSKWFERDVDWIKRHLEQDLRMSKFLFDKMVKSKLIGDEYYGAYANSTT